MSESYTTLEDSPGMLKAFENAGIEPDAGNANGEETQSGANTETGGTDTGSSETDKIEGASGKDQLGSATDGGKKPDGKEKKAKDAGDPNDLKLADGSIVKAGAERRHYETAQLTKQQLGISRGETASVRSQMAGLQTKYDELSSTISKIGMEKPEDVSAAVNLYKDINRDPQGTMVKLLAEMKAKGYTFEGIGGQIDTAALQNILDARLPSKQEQQQGLTKEQVDEQATRDVTEFIGRFPDAVTHEGHIAALIDRSVQMGKPMSLTDAYFALRERVIADGLDWSKDLGPQLEARKQSQQQQQQPGPKPRAGARTVIDANPTDQAKNIVPERDMDSDSIVLAAMQEHGLKLNA